MIKNTIKFLGLLVMSVLISACGNTKTVVTTYKSAELSVLNASDATNTMEIYIEANKTSRYTMAAKIAFDTNVQQYKGFNPLFYKCSKGKPSKALDSMNIAYSFPYAQESNAKDKVGYIFFDDDKLSKSGILVGDTIVEDMCVIPYMVVIQNPSKAKSITIKKSDLQKVYEDFLKVK